MKGITNDVYGQNMTRQDAEPKITPKKLKRGRFGQSPVENRVFGSDNLTDAQRLERENDLLSSMQRKG